MTRAQIVYGIVLARCRADGGPMVLVKATTKDGKPFETTLPPHDAKFMALELEYNGFTDVTTEAVN